jgi:phosphatidylglycerol:prolipoprotein diacylglycerol transferase
VHPRVVLEARSGLELGLIALLALVALLCAGGWRSRSAPLALFGAYFAALLAVLLALHALLRGAPFAVSTYAVFLLLGAFAAWRMLLRRLPEAGLPLRGVYAAILGCLVLGVVGGRVAELAGDWLVGRDEAVTGGRIAGLGVFGAFTLDVVYVTVLIRLAYPGVSVLRVLDAGAAPSLVNVGVARIGCLLAGCCYGRSSDAFFAIPITWFDPSSPARASSTVATSLWPSQPLEATLVLALAFACHRLWLRREDLALAPGAVIGAAGIGYGALRFALEWVRADSIRLRFGLTIWQYCALALVLAGAFATSSTWRGHEHRPDRP